MAANSGACVICMSSQEKVAGSTSERVVRLECCFNFNRLITEKYVLKDTRMGTVLFCVLKL